MGIKGLLPIFKSVVRSNVHISEFAGKTAAIDGYVWLHRYAVACAEDLCLNKPTNKFVGGFISRVNLLVTNGVTPIVVFDGGPLPMKAEEEAARRKRRQESMQTARATASYQDFMKALDVTPQMAVRVQRLLVAAGIQCIIAPFEADAQLAYLVREGLADLVITEDSDLIPYGGGHMLYKLGVDGTGDYLDTARLQESTALDFSRFTSDMLLDMCILSGCDYLPSVRKVGIRTAHKLIADAGDGPSAILQLSLSGKYSVPADYEARFALARRTFRHQLVFDPRAATIVPLTPLPVDDAVDPAVDEAHLGRRWADPQARAVATGRVHPGTAAPWPKDGQWGLHLAGEVAKADRAAFAKSLPGMTHGATPTPTQTSQPQARAPLTSRSTYQPPTMRIVHRRWNPAPAGSQGSSEGSTPSDVGSQFSQMLSSSGSDGLFKPVRRSVKRVGYTAAPVYNIYDTPHESR